MCLHCVTYAIKKSKKRKNCKAINKCSPFTLSRATFTCVLHVSVKRQQSKNQKSPGFLTEHAAYISHRNKWKLKKK